jgi:hypothetical protein
LYITKPSLITSSYYYGDIIKDGITYDAIIINHLNIKYKTKDFVSFNLYSYCGNNPVMGYDPMGTFNWGTFLKGALMVATAASAIAISIATFGAATPLAMAIVAGVTLGAGVLTGVNGIATMIEAGTDYNFVRDGLFNDVLGLSDNAYNWYAGITEAVAIVGSIACSAWQITSKIKGFTNHGLESALGHDGVGVSARAMQNATRKPLEVIAQSCGRLKYIGKNAVVVLNQAGKVITTFAKNSRGTRYLLGLWLGYELLQERGNY